MADTASRRGLVLADAGGSGRHLFGVLPAGRALPARVWNARHRGILAFLWAHVPFLFVFGLLTHHSVEHSFADVQPIIVAAALATYPHFSRAWRSGIATFGLVACSAVLVHLSGGIIEMHFHFFVVVGVITLYQDWIPFCVAILFTVIEHGVVAVISPTSVYNHHAAQAHPWQWALIHGAFVLAASVPLVLAWRQNEEQTLRDPLTRLSNRTFLAERLDQAIKRSDTATREVAVLFIDLDHFKQVNDTLGHAAGDEVLVVCAARLVRAVRDGDVTGRFGGDEFAVIIEGQTRPQAQEAARRLLEVIADPIVVSGHELVMTASIGIAFAVAKTTADEVLRNADLAMYVAKSSGRDCYDVYDDSMHERAVERLELQADLRHALANGAITVDCQPIVETATGRMTGVEVLARWRHAERGQVPPAVFIPIAERTGLIGPIGQHVFAEACAIAARLQARDPHFTVTVNVSPVQLTDPNLPTAFAALLRTHNAQPHGIVLEITESALMQDLATAAQRLTQLKALGVRLAVDDFGVGHSSLSYLRNLPVDILKIDKSFVDALPDGNQLARVIIQLGRTLGLDIVAEGVETAAQRDELNVLGCPHAQGFLYARPMSLHDLEQQLIKHRPTHPWANTTPVRELQHDEAATLDTAT